MNYKSLFRLTISSSSLLSLNYLLANNIFASPPPPFTFAQPPQFSITSIGEFVAGISLLLFIIAAMLVFAYLIWGGIEWLTSGGDSAKTKAARERITAALIGISLLSLAVAIIFIIQKFFGIQVFNNGVVLPKGY